MGDLLVKKRERRRPGADLCAKEIFAGEKMENDGGGSSSAT